MLLEGSVTYTDSNNLGLIGQAADDYIQGALLVNPLEMEFDANAPDNNLAVYFDVFTDHSVSIQNQITNNWLENNTAVQDAIAKNPITVSLSGLSGELVYVPSTNDKRFLRSIYESINAQRNGGADSNLLRDYTVTDKLTVIPQLLPPVDNITQKAKNLVTQVEDNIARYKKIASNFVRNINSKTRIQEIYEKLILLRDTDTELIIETPFKTFENMYIQSVDLTQPNQNHIVNISITLMQLNFTDVEKTASDQNVLAKYNAIQRAQVENHGITRGKTVNNNTIIGSWIPNAPAEYYNPS